MPAADVLFSFHSNFVMFFSPSHRLYRIHVYLTQVACSCEYRIALRARRETYLAFLPLHVQIIFAQQQNSFDASSHSTFLLIDEHANTYNNNNNTRVEKTHHEIRLCISEFPAPPPVTYSFNDSYYYICFPTYIVCVYGIYTYRGNRTLRVRILYIDIYIYAQALLDREIFERIYTVYEFVNVQKKK